MRISHSSFKSSMDKNGFCHTLSIDPKVVERQFNSVVYEAKLRSDGGIRDHRDGTIAHAKFSNDKSVCSQQWAETEVSKCRFAQSIAEKFNNTNRHLNAVRRCTSNPSLQKDTQNIEFDIPQTAELASISSFDKSRKKNERMLIVRRFDDLETFICTSGESRRRPKSNREKRSKSLSVSAKDDNDNMDRASQASLAIQRIRSHSESGHERIPSHILDQLCSLTVCDAQHTCLHAFVHYFFCYNNGDMAVDCLEGEQTKGGFTLTVPSIHSKDFRWGSSDDGPDGILRTVNNHVCNDLCCHLPPMVSDTFVNRTPGSRSMC